jgi:hypothetical protein
MIRKSAILIVAALYILTPYLITNINTRCQCGCQEFICYCCKPSTNYGDVASLSECECNMIDESYVQTPVIVAYFLEMGFILDRVPQVPSCEKDSILPGYKEPPMKPPPAT